MAKRMKKMRGASKGNKVPDGVHRATHEKSGHKAKRGKKRY